MLNDHRWPHAVQLIPRMLVFNRRTKMIAQRHRSLLTYRILTTPATRSKVVSHASRGGDTHRYSHVIWWFRPPYQLHSPARCRRAFHHSNNTDSTASPGPKAKATIGRGAWIRRIRSMMKRTVGDDMLPYSDRIS